MTPVLWTNGFVFSQMDPFPLVFLSKQTTFPGITTICPYENNLHHPPAWFLVDCAYSSALTWYKPDNVMCNAPIIRQSRCRIIYRLNLLCEDILTCVDIHKTGSNDCIDAKRKFMLCQQNYQYIFLLKYIRTCTFSSLSDFILVRTCRRF